MGMESFGGNEQPQEDVIGDYLELAKQSAQEREMEQNLPKLSEAEERQIRHEIEETRNSLQRAINEENVIRDRVSSIPGAVLDSDELDQIRIAQKKQVALQSAVDRLENSLRGRVQQ